MEQARGDAKLPLRAIHRVLAPPRWRPLSIEGLFVSANAASVEGKACELADNSA